MFHLTNSILSSGTFVNTKLGKRFIKLALNNVFETETSYTPLEANNSIHNGQQKFLFAINTFILNADFEYFQNDFLFVPLLNAELVDVKYRIENYILSVS